MDESQTEPPDTRRVPLYTEQQPMSPYSYKKLLEISCVDSHADTVDGTKIVQCPQ